MTIGDAIRSMNDEELAEWIFINVDDELKCTMCAKSPYRMKNPTKCDGRCHKGISKYLKKKKVVY